MNRATCIMYLCVLLFTVHCSLSTAYAEDTPLSLMRDELLSYFKPLRGGIVSVSDGEAVSDIGDRLQVKKGMRFTVFREGVPFLHPVTKEPLGTMETVIGKVEVKDVGPETSRMIILKGDVKKSDKLRISETSVRVLFYQAGNVDWSLADSYYRMLKETGRLELIDTAIETGNDAEIIEEAKRLNTDAALILSARGTDEDFILKQRLFWIDTPPIPPLAKGGKGGFAESEVKITDAFVKNLKFGEDFFGPQRVDSKLYVDLPFGVRLIASGDIDGDGKAEILMSTGKDVRFYAIGEKLNSLPEIKGEASDDHLWLDTIDINGDGRSEIIVTLMKNETVISRIYELKDAMFSVIWEGKVFLRHIGNELVAQAYAHGEGFKGPVFVILRDDGYKRGNNVDLPGDVNIYDFTYINDPAGGRLILAYDDSGHLNLYDDKGIKIWRSKEDYGGLITTFKRITPTDMVDRGEWSIKDKFFLQNKEVLVIKRIPFARMAKGLGYSHSQIKSLRWTGTSMEEKAVIEKIPGNVLDYSVMNERLISIGRPLLGIKFENILKGENPLGSALYIYSLKGK
ncbi:MAG: VCBS repeat-containing protein [Nitrospirae bacterium]|nr:VCBS repeat-containing protein [Nitrospirota bacterium]